VIVRAPASSANIGPGFDCIAVALDLWNELEVSAGEPGRVIVEIEGEGAGELPEDDSNLALRAFALLASPAGMRFRLRNRIPLERGLGSSAAAIALGLAAAQPAATAEELLAHGLGLEPHPDNLAAALVGGVCLTWDGTIARIADRLPLHAVLVVPPGRMRTEAARASLPSVVPHDDAAFTAARALLLGAGIGGFDPGLMSRGLADRLHEPYRPSALLDALRGELPAGATGATLSGSGPSVVVWAVDPAVCADDLALRFPEHAVHPLAVVPHGALGTGA
jgi:homoserine kinase